MGGSVSQLKPLCFGLMPFGRKSHGSGRTVDFDAVYDQILDPAAEAAGMTLEIQDLDELARYCLQGIREQRFVIMIGHGEARATLQGRAERIGRGDLPIDPAGVPAM